MRLIITLPIILAGCASGYSLTQSELTSKIDTCQYTEQEKQLVSNNTIKAGMQECAVLAAMGNPRSVFKEAESTKLLYLFGVKDSGKERVLITIRNGVVDSIEVMTKFGWSVAPSFPVEYEFDPSTRIPI